MSKSDVNSLSNQDINLSKIENLENQIKLLKNMLLNVQNPELLEYLSDNEKITLNYLNNMSNTLSDQDKFIKDIMNKPLKEIIENWSLTHQDILKDFMDTFQNRDIFKDISSTTEWWNPIFKVLKDIHSILFKDDRMIYVGVTIVFIAFILVFINITSTNSTVIEK